MDTPTHFTGPVNLGNPEEISIADLAQQIIQLIRSIKFLSPYLSDHSNSF
jgi:hypothetical protein